VQTKEEIKKYKMNTMVSADMRRNGEFVRRKSANNGREKEF